MSQLRAPTTPLALEQLTAALALEPANPEATLLQSQLKQ
jgi:hypothetical protein